MPERIRDLHTLLKDLFWLLDVVDQCSPVLFDRRFREGLAPAIHDAIRRQPELEELTPNSTDDSDFPGPLRDAGLTGEQLEFKLRAFESAFDEFNERGTAQAMHDALENGSVIIGSLAGAVPGVGSFLQELIDYIVKELRRRLSPRRWFSFDG